jgi:chromosome partitioning protein
VAVIAVYSVKGGVGKTTISANLAYCSAMVSCRRTLLWDLDAAGGAGFLYGVDPRPRHAAGGLFAKDADPSDLIRKSSFPKLDILPADESLRDLDSLLTRIGKKRRLAKIAEDLSRRYERIILDCPPVLNEVSAQVVRAADCIIVPIPPSPLSARAFDMVTEEIRRHAKDHPPILPVLSMIDGRRAPCRAGRTPGLAGHSAGQRGGTVCRPPPTRGCLRPQQPGRPRLWPVVDRDRTAPRAIGLPDRGSAGLCCRHGGARRHRSNRRADRRFGQCERQCDG